MVFSSLDPVGLSVTVNFTKDMAENLRAEPILAKNKDGASRAPGSHPSDQPKHRRERPRKDPNGVQASKSDLPVAAFERTGEDEELTCPLCQEAIFQATSNREDTKLSFDQRWCDNQNICLTGWL